MRTRSRLWFAVAACIVIVPGLDTTRADPPAARVYLKAADSLFKEWRYREALAMYSRAERAVDPGDRFEAALGIASSALRLGQFDLAYRTADGARTGRAGDPRALTAFGEAAWGNGLFEEADAAFTQALARTPGNARARLGFARVLLARGHPEQALEQALAAADQASDQADSHYLCGIVYERLAQPGLAARCYERYLALAPASASDKRNWVAAQIQLLRSFDGRGPARLDSQASAETVPFELSADKIVVRAGANGSAVDFQLDTGAEATVLSQRTASRVGVSRLGTTLSAGIGDAGLRGVANARLHTLRIGALQMRDVPCLVNHASPDGTGVLEPDVFSPLAAGLSVGIDYRRRRLTVARALPADAYDVEVPLWFYRLATVGGAFDNRHAGRFIVDTGARAISIASDTAAAVADRPGLRRIPVPVFGLSGRDRDAYLLLGADVALGPVTLTRAPVVVLDLQTAGERLGYRVRGIAGQQFLSRYRVSIDLKRGVLGLNSDVAADRRP